SQNEGLTTFLSKWRIRYSIAARGGSCSASARMVWITRRDHSTACRQEGQPHCRCATTRAALASSHAPSANAKKPPKGKKPIVIWLRPYKYNSLLCSVPIVINTPQVILTRPRIYGKSGPG